MTEKHFILPVSSDTRIRHYHQTQKGKVTDFVLQLEVKFRGSWRQVVRYDTSHGFTHIDRYNLKGEKKKEPLKLNYEETLTRAERDIKNNWRVYRSKFLGGDFP